MLTAKEAQKYANNAYEEYDEVFTNEVKGIQKDVDAFLDKSDVEAYLDHLVKKSARTGAAYFDVKDFLDYSNLVSAWDAEAQKLNEKYPTVLKLNDVNNDLKWEFERRCRRILAKYQYTITNRYENEFTWQIINNGEKKSNLIQRMFDEHQKLKQLDYHFERLQLDRQKQDQVDEETRKMKNFAKILVTELRKKDVE